MSLDKNILGTQLWTITSRGWEDVEEWDYSSVYDEDGNWTGPKLVKTRVWKEETSKPFVF